MRSITKREEQTGRGVAPSGNTGEDSVEDEIGTGSRKTGKAD